MLFIDVRALGKLETRVFRVFDEETIGQISATYHAWRGSTVDFGCPPHGEAESGRADTPYEDVPGFCKSATLAEIAEHGHILTPGRYVGAQAVEDDDEAFTQKMTNLSSQLREQFAQSDALEAEIKRNLAGLGYEI